VFIVFGRKGKIFRRSGRGIDAIFYCWEGGGETKKQLYTKAAPGEEDLTERKKKRKERGGKVSHYYKNHRRAQGKKAMRTPQGFMEREKKGEKEEGVGHAFFNTGARLPGAKKKGRGTAGRRFLDEKEKKRGRVLPAPVSRNSPLAGDKGR